MHSNTSELTTSVSKFSKTTSYSTHPGLTIEKLRIEICRLCIVYAHRFPGIEYKDP